MSINQSLGAQGFGSALEATFSLHNLGHANNLARHGTLIDPAGTQTIRRAARSTPAGGAATGSMTDSA